MSVTTSTHLSAQSGSEDIEAGAGLISLNPEDGLFLRAEHLTTIQDYARALAMAVGQAAGAGVVWGLDLRIDEQARKARLETLRTKEEALEEQAEAATAKDEALRLRRAAAKAKAERKAKA